MEGLKSEIIANRKQELAKGETKNEDEFNIEQSQLDAFAKNLALMAQDSHDKAMKVIEDSALLQIDEGDEALADVEIDDGDAKNAEQPLGA